jgi:fatty-acyl-CoA synthase
MQHGRRIGNRAAGRNRVIRKGGYNANESPLYSNAIVMQLAPPWPRDGTSCRDPQMMNAYSLRIFLRTIRWLPAMLRARPGKRYTSADLVESSARRFGDRVFVEFEGRTTSYAEFNRYANRVAHWAIDRGLRRGDVVALIMENRPQYLGVWAGLAKVGVTTALINTHLGGHALEHVIESAACRVVVVGDECLPAYRDIASAHVRALPVYLSRRDGAAVDPAEAGFASLDRELGACPTDNPPASVRAGLQSGDPLFYIYTSGTTGLPKAARFSHARFVAGGSYHLWSGFGARDALYCSLPLYHTVGGVICVNAVLLTGARLVLRRGFSASQILAGPRGIRRHDVPVHRRDVPLPARAAAR